MFAHLLTDFVWVSEPSGLDSFGDRTYGAWIKIPAAVEHGTSKVFDTDGNEVTSSVSFSHALPISIDARIALAAGDMLNADKYRAVIATSSASSRRTGLILYDTFL